MTYLELMRALLFQWECKTDMDNNYRFGTVEVVCEGYDYPDDPYILKGSCGVSKQIIDSLNHIVRSQENADNISKTHCYFVLIKCEYCIAKDSRIAKDSHK